MSTTLVSPKPRRKDVPEGKVLCEYCTAKCCRYFAMPIEAPEEFTDLEYIRWYLLHERATVFKEDEADKTRTLTIEAGDYVVVAYSAAEAFRAPTIATSAFSSKRTSPFIVMIGGASSSSASAGG